MHVLVVPVQHRPTLLDLVDDELAPLMEAVRDVSRAIVAAYDPPGLSVWQTRMTGRWRTETPFTHTNRDNHGHDPRLEQHLRPIRARVLDEER